NDLTIIRRNGGITSGLNILLYAGTDLLVGGNLSIATDISNLETGANIDVLANRNLTVGGSLALETSTTAQSGTGANIDLRAGGDTMLLINNNINEVVNGANILAAIGGNLNTNNLTLELLNNGGEIGTGGIVSLTVAGNITAHGDALFDIQNNGGTLDQITGI